MVLEFKPIHDHLPVLSEGRFRFEEPPYQLITFLNQALKDRGLIFGLRQVGPQEYQISVYDLTSAGTPEEG